MIFTYSTFPKLLDSRNRMADDRSELLRRGLARVAKIDFVVPRVKIQPIPLLCRKRIQLRHGRGLVIIRADV